MSEQQSQPQVIIHNRNVNKGCGSGCGTAVLLVLCLPLLGALVVALKSLAPLLMLAAVAAGAWWLWKSPTGRNLRARAFRQREDRQDQENRP